MKSIVDRATPGVYDRKRTSLRVKESTSVLFAVNARSRSICQPDPRTILDGASFSGGSERVVEIRAGALLCVRAERRAFAPYNVMGPAYARKRESTYPKWKIFAVSRELLACYESFARSTDGCRFSGDYRGAGLEGYGRPDPAELLLEILVAAQNVASSVHDRGALGD
jgi:hypothetical protein